MSYDIMVFDAKDAPRRRERFISWYEKQTEWSEGHSYDDPAVTTPELREWFMDMQKTFPAMNGPYSPTDEQWDDMSEEQELFVTDYSVGKHCIYTAFAWTLANEAKKHARKLAKKHGVGFFEASDEEGEIIFPKV